MKAVLSVILLFVSLSTHAIETDQFVTWGVDLKDSTPVINDYIQEKMAAVLTKANKKKRAWSCEKIGREIFTQIKGRFSISAISQWAGETPLIERTPEVSVKMKDYQNKSLYQHAKFPISMVGLSRNINVNGVYMGTDKLGHFILLGRNYYNRYFRKLKKFKGDKEKAMVATIKRGIVDEYIFLGYVLGGVFSYADLEANYQGLLFGLDICTEGEGYLIKKDGKWAFNPNKTFDIREYFSPKMDESYNLSFWKPKLWKRSVSKVIKKNYCEMLSSDAVQERFAHYKTLEKQFEGKRSQEAILKKLYKEMFKGKLAKRGQSVAGACASK